MSLSNRNEFNLIERWAEILPAPRPKVLLGIGDDAACLADLKAPVFSCDALIENVHFRTDWMTPRQLGWKSLAVNISDMAAMGALPVAVTVSLALPPQTATDWVEELYRGFGDAVSRFECSIVGGDTTRAGEIMISVAIIGELMTAHALRRDGAKEGDVILVTGFPGESAAGLAVLQNKEKPQTAFEKHCVEKHLLPQPRIREIQAALKMQGAIHAAIDISDGLVGDAAHIAKQSQLELVIKADQTPLSENSKQTAIALGADPLQWALAGGEDYELLLCVDPSAAGKIVDLIQTATHTPVHQIGYCRKSTTEAAKVLLYNNKEEMPLPQSWRHF
jgi:thiamine-monophosphate kinase